MWNPLQEMASSPNLSQDSLPLAVLPLDSGLMFCFFLREGWSLVPLFVGHPSGLLHSKVAYGTRYSLFLDVRFPLIAADLYIVVFVPIDLRVSG